MPGMSTEHLPNLLCSVFLLLCMGSILSEGLGVGATAAAAAAVCWRVPTSAPFRWMMQVARSCEGRRSRHTHSIQIDNPFLSVLASLFSFSVLLFLGVSLAALA